MINQLVERIQAQMEDVSKKYDTHEDKKAALVGQYTALKMVLNTINELHNEQQATEDSKPVPQTKRKKKAAAASKQPAGTAG